jgi:hypothetical protein
LAFVQGVETATLNARRMEEHVVSTPRADEAEAFIRQPFDSAFCHLYVSFALNGRRPTYDS